MSYRTTSVADLVWLSLAMSFLLLAGCGRDRDGGADSRVMVLVAVSLSAALGEVADLFEESDSARITVVPGPTNALAHQILAGAPADVFVPANQLWADAVIEAGQVVGIVDLLRNRLVLIVPEGNPAGVGSLQDLADRSGLRLALAAESVPAGIYGTQALQSANVFAAMDDSRTIVYGSDVRVATTYVERTEADAGLVYATEAKASRRVEVVEVIDESLHDPILYPALLLRADPTSDRGASTAADRVAALSDRAEASSPADRFFAFLGSPEAQLVFARHGFEPAEPVEPVDPDGSAGDARK